MPSWITILIQLLPLILQLIQQLFPPKGGAKLGPFQRHFVAMACGRMQAFIDKAKAAGVTGEEIAAAQAEDPDL